jgi:hypothetical protein
MTNDGGPAFVPVCDERYSGVSVRDYFAAKALDGILGSRVGFLVDTGTDNAAAWAYRVADSMLTERERGRVDEAKEELICACEVALADLQDGGNDEGEAGAALKSAIAHARGEQVTT